jgi:hypothetical protein
MKITIVLSGPDTGIVENVELDVTAHWETAWWDNYVAENRVIENWTRTNWLNIPIENFTKEKIDSNYTSFTYVCTITPVVLPPSGVSSLYEFQAFPYTKDIAFYGDTAYAASSAENYENGLI